jgi:putative sterol carrier protein
VILAEPERANLLAIILHRLLPKPPEGSYRLQAGAMVARIVDGRVESGDGPADCSVEGSLAEFVRLALGASPIRAWLAGRVRLRGSPFRALRLLKAFRCRN